MALQFRCSAEGCIHRLSSWTPALAANSRSRGRRSVLTHFASSISRVQLSHSVVSSSKVTETGKTTDFGRSWDEYKKYFHFPPASRGRDFQVGHQVTVHGFLSKRRDRSSKLSFVDILADDAPKLQVRSEWVERGSPAHLAHQDLKAAPRWSSVSVTATVARVGKRPGGTDMASSSSPRFPAGVDEIDLDLISIQVLNPWPKDLIVSDGVQFPQTARHLQLRFSRNLRERLRFREFVKSAAEDVLRSEKLSETETPILFKSTPEGAREFLVPTRRPGFAYALPQSPQQYKQTLMSAGFGGYFQFARCFRDEDLRADRQPEFTQLDLEMSFATGEDVMATVERLMRHVYQGVSSTFVRSIGASDPSDWCPLRRDRAQVKPGSLESDHQDYPVISDGPFPRISYHDAMSLYGSDKPDLRIPGQIRRIDHLLPADFVSKISPLPQPIVDGWQCSFRGRPLAEYRQFFGDVLDSLPKALGRNPEGEPVVLLYDSSKPLSGFSALGFSATHELTDGCQEGDFLILQARSNRPLEGGSSALGMIRNRIYNKAVAGGFLPHDGSFQFLWVTGFPLFTPNNDVDPGQGGASGFSSTHHPFTAPLASEDFELLAVDPLKAKADHYDLVVNGTELGGGSRRIHVAHVQEFVLRNILMMTDRGVAQFRHLLEALRAGCPPHAGFALGFDRLVAILSGTNSVRDVIAFPKTMKGEDPFTKSPSPFTESQLETYHLALEKPAQPALREASAENPLT